jgi:hypothetical protein
MRQQGDARRRQQFSRLASAAKSETAPATTPPKQDVPDPPPETLPPG